MVTHMKTTIDIADALYEQARCVARERGVTIRTLVEEGLRKELESPPGPAPRKMRDFSVGGEGLSPEFQNATWEQMRAEIYGEKRGG